MQSKTSHEKEILGEIKNLPQSALSKILKLIQFYKNELLEEKSEEKRKTTGFCGIWEDERSADEIIDDIYSHRTGFGSRKIEL
jgi:hypothetical protein